MILASNGIIAGKGADTDALAFITAANITDTTQKSAINQLVSDLKSANIWSKMKAIYPFVGGTAETHRWNLKNTNSFKIDWYGATTHDSNGITGNGSSYGNTNLIPSVSLTNNSLNISVFTRTASSASETQIGCSTSSYLPIIGLSTYNIAGQAFFDGYDFTDHRIISASLPNGVGFYQGNILTSTNQKLYKNNSIIASTTIAQTLSQPTVQPLYILARNDSGTASNYSQRNLSFASIGDGLTDSEATAFYNAVLAFQVNLGGGR